MNPADITPPAIQCVYKPFPVYQEVHQANANANANTAWYNRPAVNPPSMMVLKFSFCWNCLRDALIRLVWSFLGKALHLEVFVPFLRMKGGVITVTWSFKITTKLNQIQQFDPQEGMIYCRTLALISAYQINSHTHSSTVRLRNSSSWSSAEHILLRCDIFSHPFQTLSTCCSCSASSSSSSSTTCLEKPGGSCMSKQEVIV